MFSKTGLDKARARLNRLRKNFNVFKEARLNIGDHGGRVLSKFSAYENAFRTQMNDDFYTPGAIKVLEMFASKLAETGSKLDEHSKAETEARFRRMANVVGIL